jgi:hypothetical protein
MDVWLINPDWQFSAEAWSICGDLIVGTFVAEAGNDPRFYGYVAKAIPPLATQPAEPWTFL